MLMLILAYSTFRRPAKSEPAYEIFLDLWIADPTGERNYYGTTRRFERLMTHAGIIAKMNTIAIIMNPS